MASFPQVSPPKPYMHLHYPPYVLHALPIAVFLILSPQQYLVKSTVHKAPRYVVFSTPLLPLPSRPDILLSTLFSKTISLRRAINMYVLQDIPQSKSYEISSWRQRKPGPLNVGHAQIDFSPRRRWRQAATDALVVWFWQPRHRPSLPRGDRILQPVALSQYFYCSPQATLSLSRSFPLILTI